MAENVTVDEARELLLGIKGHGLEKQILKS